MKKLLLSRRGAAIELAIGVMLLMMAVSVVLLTLATIKHDRQEDDIAQLESRIELNEIGEYVCANRADYGEEAKNVTIGDKVTDFSATKTVDDVTENITLIITENGQTVLTIELKDDGTILSWK